MSDEATQAPDEVQDTPTPADAASPPEKPAEQEQEPTVDWEQRYNSLRPEYDRSNQLLAAARGDHGPEAQIEAARQLGWDVQQQPQGEEDLFEDPEERRQREIAEIREQLKQREEADEWAEFEQLETAFVKETLAGLEGDENVKLSDKERKWVETQAKANRLDSGEPNLKGAFDDLKGIKSDARDEYLASKKAPKAPAGAVGEEEIDLSDKEKRNKWIVDQIGDELVEGS